MISRWQASEIESLGLTILLVFLGTGATLAEDTKPPSDGPLLYRKIFVPEKSIRNQEAIAVGTDAYLPVKREDFEQLLSGVRVRHLAAEMIVESRIVKSSYTARLVDDLVLSGTGQLSIVHSGDAPLALPLEPCNLAIGRTEWLSDQNDVGDGASSGEPTPVQVGYEETGETVVVVDRSGIVQFDWSLRGNETVTGDRAFDLRLLPCSVNHFTLVLEKELVPVVRGAVVTRSDLAEEGGYHSWLIELRGSTSAALRIGAAKRMRSEGSLALLRQKSVCQIGPDTSNLAVVLSLDVHQRPLSHLTLEMDESFRLVSASTEAGSLSWSEAKMNARRQVTLEFAEPLSGIGQEITLNGIASVALGRPWRVPRVIVRDALWLEGTTTLEVPEPLVIDEISTTDCCQTDVGPLTAPQRGESIQIQDYQPRAIAQVLLRHREIEPVAHTGSSVELGTTRTNLVYVAEIVGGSPPRFLLEMDSSIDWHFDTVETQPPELLRQWKASGRAGRQRLVQISLKSALPSDSAMRVVIHAHRDGLRAEQSLSGRQLRLGTLRNVTTARSVAVLAADAPSQLQMVGGTDLTRLAPSNLSEQDSRLVQTPPGAVAFVDNAGADDLSVSLSTSPNFEASIRIDADFRDDQIQREYSIRCVPQASSLDRVQVHFTESLGLPLRWRWIGESEVPIKATRVDDEDTVTDSSALGETWEIMLPRPQDKPFELRASGTDEFTDEFSVPLVSVLGAKPQLGTLAIRSTDAVPMEIVQRGLKAVPAEVPPPKDYTSARGVFRYEPSLEGRLLVRRTESPQHDLARVWVCQVDSRVFRDGSGAHTAVYRIENHGEPQVELTVPRGVQLLNVLLDDQSVALPSTSSDGESIAVSLPPGQRFPSLTAHYTTKVDRLSPISQVTVPWLDLNLPTFQRRWVLWLPPGYETSSAAPGTLSTAWSRRLFGPVLRHRDRLRFDPSSQEHWESSLELDDPAASRSELEENSHRRPGSVGCPDDLLTPGDAGRLLGQHVPRMCWAVGERDTVDTLAGRGWSAHLIDPAENRVAPGSATITTSACVVQTGFLSAVAWGVFLIAAGLAGWLVRKRLLIGLPLIALVGLAALFAPQVIAPIVTSCFLGVLVSTVFLLIRPMAMQEKHVSSESHSSRPTLVLLKNATAIWVLVIIWLSVALAEARSADEPRSVEEPPKVYRVLFPIREAPDTPEGTFEPEGPYVYVPLDFLTLMRLESSGSGGAARQWIVDDALYKAVFEWDVAEEHLLAKELVAEYQLDIQRSSARVVLPFAQEQVYLLPNRAQLDGDPAPVAWESDGTGLSVECHRGGKVQLKLAFRPRVSSSDGRSKFDIKIPPVPNALMRMQLPADALDIECSTALGRSSLDEQSGQREVQLGPIDRLVAEWPDAPYSDTRASGVEVDQFMWLDIRPGSVVLRTKFVVTCLTGQVRQLELSADPRLRMLPPGDDGPIVDRHVHDEASQSVHLLHRSPASQETEFEVNFVVTGASGIGVVRLPRLEAAADRTNRRWLGITVDESLHFDPPSDDDDRRVDPAGFATMWGQDQQPPQAAVTLPGEMWEFSLATRPRRSKLTASLGVDVSCGLRSAELHFAAEIEPVDGGCFQYRLDVPAALDVDTVSLVHEGDQQVARWSRGRSGQLVVRVKNPTSEKHKLTVGATMPITAGTEIEMPRITLPDAEIVSENVRLYRRPQVRLDKISLSGFVDVPDSLIGRHAAGRGRLKSAVHLDAQGVDAPAVRVTVWPNEPIAQGTLLTFLRRQQDAWQADTLYELRIQSGIVDALRFDIPAEWTGPLETDFEAVEEIVDIPDQDRRYLVLRPLEALTGTSQLKIRGNLATRPGERVRAPDIIPLDVHPVERYLNAPTTIGQQTVTWDTTGLHYTELPSRFADLKQDDEETYLANQPRFQATIGDIEQESGIASVDLADIHVDCRSDGYVTGTATFDVHPSGHDTCHFQLPASCQLLHAAIDDLPALLQRQGTGRWRVQLGPRQLAQQLQIVYRGQLASGQSVEEPWSLPAPNLPDLPVRTTLWTVQVSGRQQANLVSAGTPVDAWQQEVIRFEQSAERIESASEVLAEIDPDVAKRWYLTWMRRASCSHARIMFWAANRVGLDPQRVDQSITLDRRYEAMLKKLVEAGLVARTDLDASQACRSSDVWAAALGDSNSERLRVVTDGQSPVGMFRWTEDGSASHRRWTAGAVLLSLAFVASLVVPSPACEKWRVNLLALGAIVAGCIWWYWCAASFLGLALAAMSVVAWSADRFLRIRTRFPAFRLGTK